MLDSARLRLTLAYIQQRQLAHTIPPSIPEIADRLGWSRASVWRYVRALRASGHIRYEDGRDRTIRVREWV